MRKKKKNTFYRCTYSIITLSISAASHKCGNSNPVRKILVVFRFRIIIQHTGDSLYLKVQGTRQNTSSYQ